MPFILIAFNLDKAAALLKYLRLAAGTAGRKDRRKSKEKLLNWSQYVWFHRYRIRSFIFILLLVVGAAIILAPIWTSHVAFRVKMAITISIVLLTVLGAVVWYFYITGERDLDGVQIHILQPVRQP